MSPERPAVPRARWPWSRWSIAVKLPVALILLLAIAFTAMTAVVYTEMRATLTALASDRLSQAARQVAQLLEASAEQRFASARVLAARPELAGYLRSRDSALEAPVSAALTRYLGVAVDVGTAELWDQTGSRQLSVGVAFPEAAAGVRDAVMHGLRAAENGVLGPIRVDGPDLTYTTGIAIRSGSDVLGYVVERRRLDNSDNSTASLLTNLIGGDAVLLVGNAERDIWSNFVVEVPPPPMAMAMGSEAEYQRDGQTVMGRVEPVRGTPWAVEVGFPLASILAPANRLLQRALIIGLLVIVGVAAVGWALSRRTTVPLLAVTRAAEAVAAERDVPPLRIDRHDEIGRLARSFNTMAERVADSRVRLEELVRELEDRVRQRTAELSTANAELEAFSYSVSHDLRSPLRAIGGFARILAEDHPGEMTPGMRDALSVVDRNVRHMGTLIDDLLMLSQVGRQEMSRTALDMDTLVRAVADEIGRGTTGPMPRITVHALPSAVGEPTLVRQVWLNLLQNGVKFTSRRSGGQIDVGAAGDADAPVYFVRDNGVGFDMRYVDKVFGVFQRLHRADEFEGTGVGLAIVSRIVHRHGGRIWAEAEEGKGATFFFTLTPVDEHEISGAPAPAGRG